MNKKMPLVSVCVATYQHKGFIEKCLDSILMQETDFPFEIILGEDASTDGTRDLCIEYAEKHPEVIQLFLRNRSDVISIGGRPTGRFNFVENIKAATGKYIAFCDGDDYWTDPRKLQKQMDYLELHPSVICCFHGFDKIEKDGQITQGVNRAEKTFTGLESLEIHVPTLTAVFRNEIREFPAIFFQTPHGDKFLWGLLSQKGSFTRLAFKGGMYRRHAGGIYSGLKEIQKLKNSIVSRQFLANHLKGESAYYLNRNSKSHAWNGLRISFQEKDFKNAWYFMKVLTCQVDGYLLRKTLGLIKNRLRG